MSNIVVSHAYGSDEHSVWYPWFRDEVQRLGHEVDVPSLPEPQAPRLAAWRSVIAGRALAAPAGETVLVGHSIGGVNLLRFLEQHDVDRDGAFAGVVLVATPAHEIGYEELAEFFAEPFQWEEIRRAAGRVRVLVAADDPVLTPHPGEHVALFAEHLGATATVLPEGGHFGASPDDHIEVPDVVRLTIDTLGNR